MRGLFLLPWFLAVVCKTSPVVVPTVTISDGVLIGTSVPVSGGVAVNKFLGIPFAAPPIGDLRFAPPADPKGWSKPKTVTEFSPSCWQQFNCEL